MLPWFLFHPVALARKLFLNSSSKVNFNIAVVSGRIRSSIACLLITDPDNNDISCDQDSYVFFFFDTIIIKPHIKFFALTLPSLRFLNPLFIANLFKIFVLKKSLILRSLFRDLFPVRLFVFIGCALKNKLPFLFLLKC